MEDQIVTKIRRELERGIATESQAVYLLVEIRKLLDRKRWDYPTLRLCCSWAVHVELSKHQAQKIVKKVDELYTKMASGQLEEADRLELRSFFTLERFRVELDEVLTRNNVRVFDGDEWGRFLACYLKVIEDCPLICRAAGPFVDRVELIKEIADGTTASPNGDPAIWWALYKNGVHIFMMGANFEKSTRSVTELMEAGAIAAQALLEDQ